jgi:hypothetical protein
VRDIQAIHLSTEQLTAHLQESAAALDFIGEVRVFYTHL